MPVSDPADIRDYVAALEEALPSLDGREHERISEWCAWARDWARSGASRHTSLIVSFDDERDQHQYRRP